MTITTVYHMKCDAKNHCEISITIKQGELKKARKLGWFIDPNAAKYNHGPTLCPGHADSWKQYYEVF